MNAPVLALPTTHRVTASEFRRMARAGVFDAGLKLELIDGALYEMPADGWRTIDWNEAVLHWLFASLDRPYRIIADKTLELSEDLGAPRPDIWVHDRPTSKGVSAAEALLVIEIADTTLAFDTGVKARAYGAAGVRDYWVIEVERRVVQIFRQAEGGGGFAQPMTVEAGGVATALLIPSLALRLADLDLSEGE